MSCSKSLDCWRSFPTSDICGLISRRAPLRFHLVREYLVAYAPEEQPIWILAVLQGRRNPRLIAAMLRDRS
ncbi:MAG: hypothetical protein WA294_05035 [Acidobacteriaceae bacterium]